MSARCRECGCTEANACVRPASFYEAHDIVLDDGTPLVSCGWAEEDLCTACVVDADPGWVHPAGDAHETLADALEVTVDEVEDAVNTLVALGLVECNPDDVDKPSEEKRWRVVESSGEVPREQIVEQVEAITRRRS